MNEFTAQVERLVALGYPALARLTADAFRAVLEPLRQCAPTHETAFDPADGGIPFVIVPSSALITIDAALERVSRRGKRAIEQLYPRRPADFKPIDLVLPAGSAYLVCDIDRGAEFLNITPDAAYSTIMARGRSPLTIEEGIALLTHYPEFLQPNNCFSLSASRCGDKRVPALWLSEGRPKLGWCWAGNPHTWLGSASCGGRAGGTQSRARMPGFLSF